MKFESLTRPGDTSEAESIDDRLSGSVGRLSGVKRMGRRSRDAVSSDLLLG